MLIEYEKDENYNELKELLIETFENKIKIEIEEYLYIIAGAYINKEKTILDILIEKIINEYKTW